MTSAKYLLVAALFTSSMLAQQLSHPVMASRGDAVSVPRTFTTAIDTIDVLAVMVQFQTDTDARTNGNGQFDLSTPATTGLDAPPHNRQYVLDHLTFFENYYRKVSKGKTILRTTLIDSVYTLGAQMQRYSPPKSGPNTVVGDLARDSWQRVDSSGTVPDFSRYECFVVLHAGVGRDVDVAGTVGFDPTPFDIPSLYLGLNAFKGFYGASYEGISVRGGFKIANTIVIPETETRELPATPSNVLLRLGINGLLCASVGNFLGLPDLFDTNTGRSGIGRFGLMDGQAIFSFTGAFPPEPSAWEKFWLGWIQPITVSPGTSDLSIPAASVDSARVYRVPISASEYFLVENRNRDVGRNGQRVTSTYNGIIRQQTFARDTVGFNAFDLAAIKGSVIDVEDIDWSLPGGVGANNAFYDGGILIWHIDETMIAQGLVTNGVNGNPNRRGIDVEEADGSQDIGQQYGQLEAGSGSEEGTALDFWYQGNESPVNKNTFSATSHPGSGSYGGANSHVTIRDFSTRSARMTATVTLGDEVKLLPGFPKSLPNKLEAISLTAADLGGAIGSTILVTTGTQTAIKPQRVVSNDISKIYAWRTVDGNGVLKADGVFSAVETPGSTFLRSVAVRDLNNDGEPEIIAGGTNGLLTETSFVNSYSVRPRVSDSSATPVFSRSASQLFATVPLIGDSTIAFGGAKGKSFYFSFNGSPIDSLQRFADSVAIVGVSQIPGRNTAVLTTGYGTIDIVAPNSGVFPPTARDFARTVVGPAVTGMFGGEERIAFATSDGALFLLNRSLTSVQGFPVNTGEVILHSPALADVDGDGVRDIIVFAGSKIFAYNYAGASLDNFPKLVPSSQPITSHPVVADVDGDGDVDIVAVTSDGLVVAYDKHGALAKGFPLQAGIGNQSVAVFTIPSPQLSVTEIGLAVASSEDGSVTAWKTGSVGGNSAPNFPWPQYQHDAQHTGLATEQITGTPIASTFFPKERAYNWPNPVYDGTTFIRYFVKENAAVKIKIFDLAGDLVTEFSGPGVAGVDNEVAWNVADVQSGIYLAHIEASSSGQTEFAIVKIAVVK